MNYHVADFVIQLKNSYLANRRQVTVPYTTITKAIGQLLVKQQLLASIAEEVVGEKRILIVTLRYVRRKPAFTDVTIISKPSLRVQATLQQLRKLLRDQSLIVLSTSQGVLSGKDALIKHVGGEVLFKIR